MAWLLTAAGFHVPLTPLVDMPVSVGTLPPVQMVNDVPKSKTGIVLGVTVSVNVVGMAHSPALGVNVYVAVAWLSTTVGFHVPLMPLSDVVGRLGTVPPVQIVKEEPILNNGVVLGVTVNVNVVVTAHWPASGVKV